MTTKPNDLQQLLAEEPFVRALAHSLVADEADDIVQQAFLQALQHQPADLQQPRSWLARIVRNLVVDLRRRHARRDSRELAMAPQDQVPSSSELLEGEDRRRAIVAAVDRLPADQRTVVLLRYYAGCPSGRLLRPDGSPATGESVGAIRCRPQLHEDVKVNPDGTFAVEVPSGEWHIAVDVRNHPQLYEGPRALRSGETWDLGTLQLAVGGTLVVRDRGEGEVGYVIYDSHERLLGALQTQIQPLRSHLLGPGEYVLQVRGEGVAAQALPFAIRSAQETELEIQRAAGVRQRLEFLSVTGTEVRRGVEFEIRRDSKLLSVFWQSAEGPKDGPPATDIWLAPGSYSLATRNREPTSTASFTVGAAEGPPVRIVLR